MGNKLDLEAKICYSCDGFPIEMIMKELKGKKNFPKLPKEREIEKKYKEWGTKVHLETHQKAWVQMLPLKYKFRLTFKHDQKMKIIKEEEQRKQKIRDEFNIFLDSIYLQKNQINLQKLRNHLHQNDLQLKIELIHKRFIVGELIGYLRELEVSSRKSKNFRESISIMKIFEVLLADPKGIEAMKDTQDFFNVMFSTFHPIQPEITGLMLKVLGSKQGMCWQTSDCLVPILSGMDQFKDTYCLTNKFDIIIRCILNTKNVIMIYHLLYFLLNFFTSIEKPQQDPIMKEFYSTQISGKKIDDILRQVKIRIKYNKYVLVDCTYEKVRQNLMEFNHPLVNSNVPINFEFGEEEVYNYQDQPNIVVNSLDEDKELLVNKFYIENHEKQLFEQVCQKVQELLDAIMNIDLILQQIEQDELEEHAQESGMVDSIYFAGKMNGSSNSNKLDTSVNDQTIIKSLSEDDMDKYDKEDDKHEQVSFRNSNEDTEFTLKIQDLEDKNDIISKRYEESQQLIKGYEETIKMMMNEYQSKVKQIQEDYIQKAQDFYHDYQVLEQKFADNKRQLKQLNYQLKIQNNQFQPQQILIEQATQVELKYKNSSSQTTKNMIEQKLQEIHVLHKAIKQSKEQQTDKQEEQLKINVEQQKCQDQQTTKIPPPPPPPPQQEQNQNKPQIIVAPFVPPPPPPPKNQPAPPAPPPPPQQQNNSKVNPPPPPPPPPVKQTTSQPTAPPPPPLKINGPPAPPPPKTGGPPPPPPPKTNGPPLPPGPKLGGPPPPLPKINGQTTQAEHQDQTPKRMAQVPMKPLNWSVVNQQNTKNTIFQTISLDKIIIDYDFLEKNFNKAAPTGNLTQREMQKSIVIQKVSIIGPERAKNIDIVLGKIRIPPTLLAKALLQVDLKILTHSIIESLDGICPTDEEANQVREYVGEKTQLANPEQFIDAIIQIKGYQFRLKGLRFVQSVDDLINDLKTKIKGLTEGFLKLTQMSEVKTLFSVLLVTGNFMNGQNSKGNAQAFKIDVIEKLCDIKSSDGQSNLLGFIIEQTEKLMNKSIITKPEIDQFEQLASTPISQLNADFAEIKKGYIQVNKAIEAQTLDKEDKIESYLKPLFDKGQKEIEQLETSLKQLELDYLKCSQLYCENPKDSSDKFGEKILKLFKQIFKVKNEMIAKEERLKKMAQSKKMEEDRKRMLESKQMQQSIILNKSAPNQNSSLQPPKPTAQTNQFAISQAELALKLQPKQQTFLSNEIKELRQLKQQRASILQTNQRQSVFHKSK